MKQNKTYLLLNAQRPVVFGVAPVSGLRFRPPFGV